MGVEHVVILTMENRSFDEYFGTLPGANGFYGSDDFANRWIAGNGWTGPSVVPFRLSTFSSQQSHPPGCQHGASQQHASFADGALNGWASQAAKNPVGCMGYYAANDIPYHWWLAENFAVCDNYFCSVLGPTEPNRMYVMTGKIEPSAEFLGNPGYAPAPSWQTYADMLTPTVSWRVYDGIDDQPPADFPIGGAVSPELGWDLNAFSYFSSWAGLQGATVASPAYPNPPYYKAGLDAFLADAAGELPTVSWIFPQYARTEHPPFSAADGAVAISQVLEALLAGPNWDTTVFIVNYDENDGHFDHVVPPQPASQVAYPDEYISGTSIGAGFRVPAFIISPWTVGRGVCTDTYDHTSVVKLIAEVTGVPCPNITDWRNQTFASLSTVGFTGPGTAAADVPARPDAAALAQHAINRYNANPGKSGSNGWAASLSPADLVPTVQTWPPVAQSCQVVMTRPSYSEDPVNAQAAAPGDPATFGGAFIVYVDGFEPVEFTTPDAGGAVHTIVAESPATSTCSTRCPQITILDDSGNPVPDLTVTCDSVDFDPNDPANQTESGVPKRFTFSYSLTFGDPDATFSSFPTGTVERYWVNASFTVDITVTSAAELELVNSDDPQFFHLYDNDTYYLSDELRVFSVVEGDSRFGVPMGSGSLTDPLADAIAATSFISSVASTLTSNQGNVPGLPAGEVSSFDDLGQDEDAPSSVLPLYPQVGTTGPLVYNFALARVRMQAASTDPATVRVFFRSFRASTTSTDYETAYAYRTYPLEGTNDPSPPPASDVKIPLLGLGYGQDAGEYATIPFFASPRIQLTNPTKPMTWQQDANNVQTIQTGKYDVPSEGVVEAYFGCWLDINRPSVDLFPQTVPGISTEVDGPFPAGTAMSIQSAFRDLHQCLVAEISYDPITIPTGDTTQNSAWLAQRNLAFVPAPNPGVVSSRKVLSTFDVKATVSPLPHRETPDELMFDWTELPAGTTASIYLPAVDADAVIATAGAMYGSSPFTRIDDRTLACPARGISYLPIPPGSGNNAGLLAIELPAGIHKGDVYAVVVNQITNAGAFLGDRSVDPAAAAENKRVVAGRDMEWRKIAGNFQLTIPVSTRADLLPTAENNLSVLRWILGTIPKTDRWHPVMTRYVGEFAERVEGLGGDPGRIPASPTGTWPEEHGSGDNGWGRGSGGDRWSGDTGKIDHLIFDRFGDFEGFTLFTDRGEWRTFYSREGRVREIAERAWAERIRVTIIPDEHRHDHATRIVLHSA